VSSVPRWQRRARPSVPQDGASHSSPFPADAVGSALCLGRRMADTALHLARKVIPEVPVRQWVCSLPWRLRVLCGYDRRLCAEVLEAFIVELTRS